MNDSVLAGIGAGIGAIGLTIIGLAFVALVVLWILLPFVVFGIRGRLDRLIGQVRASEEAIVKQTKASEVIIVLTMNREIQLLATIAKTLDDQSPHPQPKSKETVHCPQCKCLLDVRGLRAGVHQCPNCQNRLNLEL